MEIEKDFKRKAKFRYVHAEILAGFSLSYYQQYLES